MLHCLSDALDLAEKTLKVVMRANHILRDRRRPRPPTPLAAAHHRGALLSRRRDPARAARRAPDGRGEYLDVLRRHTEVAERAPNLAEKIRSVWLPCYGCTDSTPTKRALCTSESFASTSEPTAEPGPATTELRASSRQMLASGTTSPPRASSRLLRIERNTSSWPSAHALDWLPCYGYIGSLHPTSWPSVRAAPPRQTAIRAGG